MGRNLIILTAVKKEWENLVHTFEADNFQVIFSPAMEKLGECIRKTGSIAVIMDLDSISIDNRIVRECARGFPEVYFFWRVHGPVSP